jgi:hypothetical protein
MHHKRQNVSSALRANCQRIKSRGGASRLPEASGEDSYDAGRAIRQRHWSSRAEPSRALALALALAVIVRADEFLIAPTLQRM